VCPKCQFHFRVNAKKRLELLFDGKWTEHDAGMVSTDPLKFVDTKPYAKRIKRRKKKLGMNDAVITSRRAVERQAGDLLRDGICIYWRLDGRGGG